MIIYGAGLAGLLAANMLRRFQPVIHEAQATLPNNHEALLRFRTDAVARATGIPFRAVTVEKSVRFNGRTIGRPDIKMNNLYSHKVTGEFHQRSIADLRPAKRFIAPVDLIKQMAKSVRIVYNSPLDFATMTDRRVHVQTELDALPVISTVPMPVLSKLAKWNGKGIFKFRSIWSAWIEITSPVMDLYQTIYYPDPDLPYYRVSITGNRMIIEFTAAPDGVTLQHALEDISKDFGIQRCTITVDASNIKEQKYGKLLPIDDAERRQFILAMTDEYRIYSLGRFATWRQILMDDVVNDVAMIEKWITERSAYTRRISAWA